MQRKIDFINVFKIFAIVLLLVGAGGFGYLKMREYGSQNGGLQEQVAQKQELEQCRERLALFYKAWSAYKMDHKGGEPPNIAALIPKYISSAELLVCPTTVRWGKKGKPLQQGSVVVDRRQYPVTYGFRWLTAGYPRMLKKSGEQIPLIICEAHQEALYRASYLRPPPQNAFDPEQRAKLVPVVRDAYILAVRHNGKVDYLNSSQDN